MDRTDHEVVRGKLDSYSSGHLDDVEWVMVRTHLAECKQCSAELTRPVVWHRAAPQRIPPTAASDELLATALPQAEKTSAGSPYRSHAAVLRKPTAADSPPGWPVVGGAALVTALVAFGLGYALDSVM